LIRGWIGLQEEPIKPVAFVSTVGGVMALALGAISWWSLRKSKA